MSELLSLSRRNSPFINFATVAATANIAATAKITAIVKLQKLCKLLKLLIRLNSLKRLEGCVIQGLIANKAFDCFLAK